MEENKIEEQNLVDENQNSEFTNRVEELSKMLAESEDKYVRLYAEFDNYKRRTIKDKEELLVNTKVKMLSSILDMDNDLSIAMKSVKSEEAKEGLSLITQKLDNFLKSQGVEVIQTENYDEDLHEVIGVLPSEEEKIIDVVSKGYTLNNKPFRYPKIILGRNA